MKMISFLAALMLAVLCVHAYDNLDFGVPGPADSVVDRVGYALGYCEKYEQPLWVVYKLTREEVNVKAAERQDNFRADPEIPTGSATPADYTRSGYDRGHLAPAADMAFSVRAMSESFYMSNMSPQAPQFNRGIWAKLEKQIREFAVDKGEIYVVTGPVFREGDPVITIGANQVAVPQAYYKVVCEVAEPHRMIGFILPNEGSQKALQEFAVTVDAVEAATGLDFFSVLPDEKENAQEAVITVTDWKWLK